jgi:cation transport regulator
MPYRSIADLPSSVRGSLPKGAQEIYRAAYNAAWKEYADPGKRRTRGSREQTAHRVAWSAVKARYAKRGDRWVRRR